MKTNKMMQLIGVHAVKHSDLGFNDKLFGGQILKWVDGDAVAYAMELCDTPRVVTVAIDKCVFQKSAAQGNVIKIYAEIAVIGNTSITLNIEARRHNVYNGRQTTILSTNVKFVRVDEEGTPIPISERVKLKFKKLNQNEDDGN